MEFTLVIIALLIVGYIGYIIYTKQTDKVRKWLLYAVTIAEKELKGGTGKLKLEYVYDLFTARYTWLKVVMSRATFENLVEDALEDMRHLLNTNEAISNLVEGE